MLLRCFHDSEPLSRSFKRCNRTAQCIELGLLDLSKAGIQSPLWAFTLAIVSAFNNTILMTTKEPLSASHPELSGQAHGWDPTKFYSADKRNYEWICSLGHVWVATIHNRANGSGCHYCGNKKVLVGFNDLATTHPELAMQAHEWDPTTVVAGMKAERAWKCELGHTWTASVHNRACSGARCPYCTNTKTLPGFNDLLTKFPLIAAQAHGWDPSLVHHGEHKKREFICSNNHIWAADVGTRTQKSYGCPVCSNKLLSAVRNIVDSWHSSANSLSHNFY